MSAEEGQEVKRTLLGEVGLCILGNGIPDATAARRAPAPLTGTITEQAIAALRAAGVPPNADGSYNAVTGSGNVVRVTAP